MREFTYTIKDPVGIHGRPAANLKIESKKFSSTVTIICGEKECSAAKTLQLTSMQMKGEVTVRIEGDDEEECAAAMEKFFKENM